MVESYQLQNYEAVLECQRTWQSRPDLTYEGLYRSCAQMHFESLGRSLRLKRHTKRNVMFQMSV